MSSSTRSRPLPAQRQPTPENGPPADRSPEPTSGSGSGEADPASPGTGDVAEVEPADDTGPAETRDEAEEEPETSEQPTEAREPADSSSVGLAEIMDAAEPDAATTATTNTADAADTTGTADTAGTADATDGGGWLKRTLAATGTVLAGLLVFFATLAPNQLGWYRPGLFARIPVELILAIGVVLVLPARARRPVAAVGGFALGLLLVLKALDIGFYKVLARPFDPVLDWVLFDSALEFLTESIGRTGGIGAAIGVVLVAIGLVVLVTLSMLRLARLVVRHDRAAARGAVTLGVAWVLCGVLGVQVVPGIPVNDQSSTIQVRDRIRQVRAGLRDQQAFAREAAVDAFRDTPGEQMLTTLRGKDVVLAFVESYGRDAVVEPEFAVQIGALLDAGNQRLTAAGYASRSAFLTSPTVGGGSWLAHSTLLSGLWINNQQRYHNLLSSDRLTLNGAFKRADWRTVGGMPAIIRAWPEGAFYGYDKLYAFNNLGYRGPKFGFAPMPDQYTLAAIQQAERSDPNHPPVMAELALVSSHAPWAPLPELLDWNALGDGTVYEKIAAAGESPDEIFRDDRRVRNEYRRSIEYSLSTLISYIETYGDKDLVVVFVGDHQPSPVVTGDNPSRDVPITIVAGDPAVLDQISGWGWHEGLKPGPQAPVWRMDTFRDRFLTAFGSTPVPAS